MDSPADHAFVVDWFQDPSHMDEAHAVALQLNRTTGLYEKCLIRVKFLDYVFIVFIEDPEPALIDRARRDTGATMRLGKMKTMMGYQDKAEITTLTIRAENMPEVLKNPAIKALGGYVEENTVISRSRKLTGLRSMPQCCWISLAGLTIIGESQPTRLAKSGIVEYYVDDWQKLRGMPLDNQEAFTPPESSAIRVLSFDIEVYKRSSRGGGMPDPKDPENFVMCISVVTHEKSLLEPHGYSTESRGDKSSERREVTLHTVFDVKNPEEYLPDNTTIRRYPTEYAMIRGFWDQVARDDPILILGFNVQSWDFSYLHARMKVHGISYPTTVSIYEKPVSGIGMRKSHWSSAAFKNNDMLWPDIPGMVVLDLHKFYVRSRPTMRKHSLDYISRHYLGRGKYPVSQERMVTAYESGDPDELSAMAQYNVEDSMLVLDLFLSQHVFEEAAIEAITSETLIDDLYTKGMQVRALNKIYRYAKDDGYVVTTSPSLSIGRGEGGEGGESRLLGALVQGANPGRYDDVATYDIRSMYPTILMTNNICYTTYLPDPSDRSPEHKVYVWETKGSDDSRAHDKHEAAFVTSTVQRGMCARLLTDQVILRDRIRSWGTDKNGILRYAQKSVKAVSNSIIGLMASAFENARLAFPAAAGVVYTTGRETITRIIQDVSQWQGAKHGQVVYSDTDSILVADMGSPDSRAALLAYLNGRYAPFSFELEAVGRLLLVGPKNYIMRLNEDGSLVYKGVSFSKKTASNYVAEAMQEVTSMIMDGGHSRQDILAYLKSQIDNIHKHDIDDFVMSATVSTAANSVGGKLGRRLIAKGDILMPGDVIDYVVLTKPIMDSDCSKPRPVIYTKTGKVKKVTAPGVTDRTATPQELAACLGEGVLQGEKIGIDFSYYKEKLVAEADRLLVFD